MSDVNVKLSMVLEVNTQAEDEEAKPKTLSDATLLACRKYGAFTVRAAAIRQMRGESNALAEVGLDNYASIGDSVLDISDKAFSLLTDEEKFKDNECHFVNYKFSVCK